MSLISDGYMTWDEYSKHREGVKNEVGVYIGLLDEHFEPICDMPSVDEYTAPTSQWDPVEFSGTFLIPVGGRHPAVDDLVTTAMSGIPSPTGTTRPQTRYIIVEPKDSPRLWYRIEFTKATGGLFPTHLEVYTTSPEACVLAEMPFVNIVTGKALDDTYPLSIQYRSDPSQFQFKDIPVYVSEKLIVETPQHPDKVSDCLDRSIKLLQRLYGWSMSENRMIVSRSGDDSIVIDKRFAPLSEVIAEEAVSKGIRLDIVLRLPGDLPYVIRSKDAAAPKLPQIQFAVKGVTK